MPHPMIRAGLPVGCAVMLASTVALADGTRFSDYTPLPSSAGPTADESMPITLSNPAFQQRSIANRNAQLDEDVPNSGNWDMNAVNETGPEKGRFLFNAFETGQSGVQRHDLSTGETDTIWHALQPGDARSFDPSVWSPWGTLIVGEESWVTAPGGDATSPYGRVFEFVNPTTAPALVGPLMPDSNQGADFTHKNVVPRSSHEGIQFDADGNMYFIDELNGGCIYKYSSAAPMSKVKNGQADYFAAGQTFVLRVGDGNTPNATGAFSWVAFTDDNGNALPGAITITDTNSVTSVDARNTADVPAFKGTDYQRPEDIQIKRACGHEFLFVNTTSTHQTYVLDLGEQTISVFLDRNTIDLATGLPVGSALNSQDNLAIDHDGNIYVVEDRPGAVDDDIWFAYDKNSDGDLLDEGEGIGRWASNGTPGSEFTGLFFDPLDKRRAWVNIQHPSSGDDRTIEITIPQGGDNDANDHHDGDEGRCGH